MAANGHYISGTRLDLNSCRKAEGPGKMATSVPLVALFWGLVSVSVFPATALLLVSSEHSLKRRH